MVFKSLHSSFCGIVAIDMQGNKMVGYFSLMEGILEEITSFIIYYTELGLVYISCDCVKEFLDPFVDACT